MEVNCKWIISREVGYYRLPHGSIKVQPHFSLLQQIKQLKSETGSELT